MFVTIDQAPCPDLHFQASPICLMIQAQPHLCNVVRRRTDRANAAQSEVNTLLELYQRRPGAGCNNPIIVPVAYDLTSTMRQYNNNHPSAHVLPIIPSSPPPSHPTTSAPPISFGFDRHLGLSASTMDAPEDTEVDPDITDQQLLEYIKEPAVTWEDLKTRPPFFPGVGGGTWQFSCVEQIIRGEW